MGCSLSSVIINKKGNDGIVVCSSVQQISEEHIEQLLKTRFSRSEILEWYCAFTDKCGVRKSAHLNKARFIDYFNQLHPDGDVTRLTEAFFRTYDLDGDGVIDFMEFMHAVSTIRRGDLTEKLSLIFSLLDSNQEGYIDGLKLVKMMEALYQTKGIDYKDSYNVLLRKVNALIARFDSDKKGGRILRYKFIETCMNDGALRELLQTYK